jgi:hypothetical protein
MNDGTSGRRRQRWMWWPRAGLLAIVAGIALMAAACSSSPSTAGDPGKAPATVGPTSSATVGSGSSPSSTSKTTSDQKQLAYSRCMRSHGVPGVPTSMPSVEPGSEPSPSSANWQSAGSAGTSSGPAPGSPQWLAAQQACQSLMPVPGLAPG